MCALVAGCKQVITPLMASLCPPGGRPTRALSVNCRGNVRVRARGRGHKSWGAGPQTWGAGPQCWGPKVKCICRQPTGPLRKSMKMLSLPLLLITLLYCESDRLLKLPYTEVCGHYAEPVLLKCDILTENIRANLKCIESFAEQCCYPLLSMFFVF